MKVIKIGGGCLNGRKTIAEIIGLLEQRGPGNIVVVSALYGITDLLIESMQAALEDEKAIPRIMSRIRSRHLLVARYLILDAALMKQFSRDFSRSLIQLERLYYGLNFTRQVTPRLHDIISSFGERFSALLLAAAMQSRGIKAAYRLPQDIGLVTDGKFGDATVNMRQTRLNFSRRLLPMHTSRQVLFLPGFYGVSEQGEVTTFGRGGSDYSAAVVTAATGADLLEIWKDVDGFLSADPRFIPEAMLIPELSYDEAAELSYFGARILHPRTMEPLRAARLPVVIKNTVDPDRPGSRITPDRTVSDGVVKSVAHTTDIGILKVHASGVGARRGALGRVAAGLAGSGINIKSVVTSQTCISLLLASEDLDAGEKALRELSPSPFRRLEAIRDIALISIVGEGLASRAGVAARCFAATAECRVNIEMIAFGPSPVAMYFITRKQELKKAVAAIHSHFFGPARCLI